ncbi:MAG: hypothetical protein M0Q91_03105 [Methanoregula sp.]|jgi:hypothetical protein|nr:hypothetical protein [Methanoregula sp.]
MYSDKPILQIPGMTMPYTGTRAPGEGEGGREGRDPPYNDDDKCWVLIRQVSVIRLKFGTSGNL